MPKFLTARDKVLLSAKGATYSTGEKVLRKVAEVTKPPQPPKVLVDAGLRDAFNRLVEWTVTRIDEVANAPKAEPPAASFQFNRDSSGRVVSVETTVSHADGETYTLCHDVKRDASQRISALVPSLSN